MSVKPLPNDGPDLTTTTPVGVVAVDVCQLGQRAEHTSDPAMARSAGQASVVDWVAQEVPVALVFNGVSHAVMLASPTDLEDFARGFAWSEGIVETPEQIYDINVTPLDGGHEVRIEIASAAFMRLKEKRRNLAGRTGCGLCGTESLDQVLRPLPMVPDGRFMAVDAAVIDQALQALVPFQRLQALTGAMHAAAWFSAEGELQLMREDVGRHNALDKLIGAGLVARRPDFGGFNPGFVLVTSRASMEMVQKTLAAGFAMLVAVSAPTSMAIDMAKRHGLTLVGFARPGRCSIYHAPIDPVAANTSRDT